MSKLKFKTIESTLADAISTAFGELESLGQEAREIVDNAPPGLSETDRIQTFDSTASTLENLSEPDVPDYIGPTKLTYPEQEPRRKNRGLSRADRCGNACSILDACIDALNEEAEDADTDKRAELEALRDELENAKGDAEGCEFPGMYG